MILMKKILILVLLSVGISLRAQTLYVGANYHPHDDKNIEKIRRDIDLMKEAGFNVVRMGHLAWDSYEPTEGKFDFEWFDKVMDLMADSGINVILDIAVRPAPLWLHHKFPSVDVTDASGNRLYANHRYMDDIGDPDYQWYALRFADKLSQRYAHHPALLAFGIDNESGDGPISYSESVRKRFVNWLKAKYSTLSALNEAWDGQRWCRIIGDFDEVGLPRSGDTFGAPERVLDFRRFISDEVNGFLFKVMDRVEKNAPSALLNTNAWYYSPLKYFDYAPVAYSGKMTREGCGFYYGSSLVTNWGVVGGLFGIARIQYESENPFWCSEFTTMTAVPGSIRKSAYATLMYGNQMICGWTWQSMHGGEEQYLQGLMDWDGEVNRKYFEYKQIASEFKKIAPWFPYVPQAEVGYAFSFPSQMASGAFPQDHQSQAQTCFNIFHYRNMDARMLDIGRSDLDYKLLIIPGVTILTRAEADKVREYVSRGGTVIMTANSAMLDENGKVLDFTRPGYLDDVFGIRVASFEETEALNELSREGCLGQRLKVSYGGRSLETESARFDVIEPRGAEVIGTITSLDKDYPVITSHSFGKGRAIYVGLPARGEILDPLVDELILSLGLQQGPDVPSGVMARRIDHRHTLYLNTTSYPQTIILKGRGHSILHDRDYTGVLTLPPFEPDFVEQ